MASTVRIVRVSELAIGQEAEEITIESWDYDSTMQIRTQRATRVDNNTVLSNPWTRNATAREAFDILTSAIANGDRVEVQED